MMKIHKFIQIQGLQIGKNAKQNALEFLLFIGFNPITICINYP